MMTTFFTNNSNMPNNTEGGDKLDLAHEPDSKEFSGQPEELNFSGLGDQVISNFEVPEQELKINSLVLEELQELEEVLTTAKEALIRLLLQESKIPEIVADQDKGIDPLLKKVLGALATTEYEKLVEEIEQVKQRILDLAE